jgi:hypothetical protein
MPLAALGRGIEAVVGFTPSAQHVVKLMDTQKHFFTLGSVLEQQDYRTSFIYGGEAHFDNMRGFFLNNGFQRVIDEKDYADPEYRGTWGVSDEDLFKKADEVFSDAGSRPFFSLVFTSSNHEPFDIPPGRVGQPGDEGTETAVKYADYALGEFLQKAKLRLLERHGFSHHCRPQFESVWGAVDSHRAFPYSRADRRWPDCCARYSRHQQPDRHAADTALTDRRQRRYSRPGA